MDEAGTLFFLDALTGKLLNSYATGGSNACGASVVDGVVYTGSGYLNYGLGEGSYGGVGLVELYSCCDDDVCGWCGLYELCLPELSTG